MSEGTAVITQVKTAKVSYLQRVLSFPVMLSGLLVVLAVLTVGERFNDPDMWWHLKMGKVIWETHSIPHTDLFSYTTGHHAYIPHEWLSELLIYGAYHWRGYPGLMLWLCFLTSVLLVSGYCLCWFYSKNAKIAFLGSLTIWLFSTVGLAIRPQMVGYLLLVFELLLLHAGRARNPRWFFALPVLFAIWVNAHGSFFLGLFVAVLVLASSFLDFRAGLLTCRRWEASRRKALAFAIAFSIAALFLNPIGLSQILYPVDTLLHQPIGLSQVEEWQATQFSGGRDFAFLGIIALILLLPAIRRTELWCQELLLLALGAWLAASHHRMLFVFGILAAPILSRLLATAWDNYDAAQDFPGANAILMAVSLLIVFRMFPSQRHLENQVEARSPVKAVQFIRSHHLPGPMLNEYVYGGYLIWASPENPVFVDGRSDVFEATGVLAEFADWSTLQADPNKLLAKYRINFCLLQRHSAMVPVLSLMQWKTAYSDDISVVLVRNEQDH
ncbi:hypothetical protein [Terriglobus albidus]|uniref:hypothetical protein n=1 Tax=Terriglobus albidus TaxID=1592106 RepID=UPI0021E08554|nr:hypothetical protein [Terriglobus albidus]